MTPEHEQQDESDDCARTDADAYRQGNRKDCLPKSAPNDRYTTAIRGESRRTVPDAQNKIQDRTSWAQRVRKLDYPGARSASGPSGRPQNLQDQAGLILDSAYFLTASRAFA